MLANRSLDLTIENLGKDRFGASLKLFRSKLQYSQNKCKKVKVPCNDDGIILQQLSQKHCYAGDEGCAYKCFDDITSRDFRKLSQSETGCIPSGDQDTINKALSLRFADVILCPGAIFELTAPITYRYEYQSVYTLGRPTGPDRAVLRIADPTVTTAVVMVNCDGAELSHVIVDGNRPSLGKTVSELYDGALIHAGGGGQGQIIQHIDAYEPRGWAVLHVSEGDPVHRCSAALIENNKIGPAGEDMARASGMVMACPNSVVRGNNITNATNVGLSAFGALGSTVEKNLIVGRESSCIASGDQEAINKALSIRLAVVELCPGAVFELSSPITFKYDYQSLYTRGKPTGPDRAVLRIVDPSVTTAVVMVNRDGAELSHVIVDGNRPSLGKATPESYGNALIQAGGGGQGQIIQHVDAYEPRGWATLQMAEGDPVHRCSAALIENNNIGPAGEDVEGAQAGGIAMACSNSVVRKNNITDATSVGLSVFGAPGSTVEKNLIVTHNRAAHGGITMVDYAPYNGNFSGTIVQGNVISAENATMHVAVAMGPRVWMCMDDIRLLHQLVWGGTVRNNILKGNQMRYGFAIDGVRNWTVLGNVDEALHHGEPISTCGGAVTSAPEGFQIDRTFATGVFQDEFVDAVVQRAFYVGGQTEPLHSIRDDLLEGNICLNG